MTGKARKKLSFTHFFLKRLIPLLIAGTLLCVIGTIVIGEMIWANYESMCSFEFASVKAGILEDTISGDPEMLIKYRTALYSDYVIDQVLGTQKAIVVADPVTGEIITDSGLALYSFYKDEGDEKPNICICEDEAVLDFLAQNRGPNISYAFDQMYLREDGTFLPATVIAACNDDGFFRLPEDLVAQQDFTPADKENYRFFPDKAVTIASGTFRDNPVLAALTEAVKGKPLTEANDTLDDLYQHEDNILHVEYDTFIYKGREYAMYSLATYDLWADLSGMFIVDYAILAVIILIVSAVWAKLAHTKYSARYDSDELRRSMVDALAHDLKSPLTAISGYAENLASDTHPEKREHYASAIMENVNYMNSIITSTLELSRVENCTVLRKEQVDVTALVNELYEKYRLQAESKGISYTSEGSCIASADRALLSRVMENLITNAVKYTPEGGSVTVISTAKSVSISNTCNNTGALQSRDLTEPFAKGSESRSERTGSGMGLAIAKNACARQSLTMKLKAESDSFTATIRF